MQLTASDGAGVTENSLHIIEAALQLRVPPVLCFPKHHFTLLRAQRTSVESELEHLQYGPSTEVGTQDS